AQREPESTTPVEPTASYHMEDTTQHSEIELPDVVIPTLRFTIGSNSFLHNDMVKQATVAPFISQERTMVPLRIIAEALNAEVDWDSTTRTVIITGRGETINLIVDVPLPDDMGTPVIVNGSTFVPVRYVSETLGATVRWDGENKAVYIYGT
ncbi:MAG: copper amine oxidase N-terminal domain-containing protein, partial [Defluviitaleaceae bacterium]|nr:copper amine oxidase N-terminal domain-containing protein [Defluviitaleaceae bacterium]